MAASTSSAVIALPKGGGALHGIGEKFSPDLHTGTGNFSVPIALPPGRNGFQPQLSLVYSTGHGNGPFGLGWNLSIPGVSRKTSKGVPRYDDAQDVFILSGAEDLVPVETSGTTTRYRPRTEGSFAKVLYHHDASNRYWEVQTKGGLVSYYGTQSSFPADPATIADPSDRTKVFAWKLTRTEDPFHNRIEYEYVRDSAEAGPHHWDQLDLAKIRYVDHGDDSANPRFLVTVEFVYELRPGPGVHSEYRSGFEIRTRKRCTRIAIRTHAEEDRLVRTYDLIYLDQRPELIARRPLNGVSLLSQIKVTGHDGDKREALPPLEFGYTGFEPEKRDYFPLQGSDLPARSLANPGLELLDLFGNGLPDLMEMNGTVRYWRNLGNGRFDLPRLMNDAPAGVGLADPGVQFIDANGDGRTDLLVTTATLSGYFPLSFGGQWDRRSFQRYRQAPSFNLRDPEVKLVDLDGDGVTDAIRSGTRLECFFNDPRAGWSKTRWVERQALEVFPNVNFSDPRVKWADLTGDGLQDIALVSDGNVEYWPNLGHGNWGKPIHMQNGPRFPYGYDPKRILVGDVDGDGLADIVYVDNTKVTLWINQGGNCWSDPITILGTPPVSDVDAVRLMDVLGNGIAGVLWSRDANGLSRDHLFFLDFTGGLKPYLLDEMDNHLGAVTKVEYASSTRFYQEDQRRPETRWKTTLPFPVHVVARVEVIDHFSRGKLTTQYRYHHGHWDGAEREFRGFGMVEQLDTESFEDYDRAGLHGSDASFARIDQKRFSPPTLTKTWFHQGAVGEEFGDWQEMDWSADYWPGDPLLLKHTEAVNQFLSKWPSTPDGRRVKRDALRALRGSILRSELYALDGSDREKRPYTVTEYRYGLREESPPAGQESERLRIFFPHQTGQRTTQWERGDDPMTQFAFPGDYDPFGQPRRQTQIACPRGWRAMEDRPAQPFLATRSLSAYAAPVDDSIYIHDRVAQTISHELTRTAGKTVTEIQQQADAAEIQQQPDANVGLAPIGHTVHYYDGAAFQGLEFGKVGPFGALVRTETLALTEAQLGEAYGDEKPPYLIEAENPVWPAAYPETFKTALPRRAGYLFRAASPYTPGFYVATERRGYDFQEADDGKGQGLITATRDPFGNDTALVYDEPYRLLPVKVIDPMGLETTAQYDYRVLQPKRVTEPNGNFSEFAFTPLGLLKASSIKGKAGEGDQTQPSAVMEYRFQAFAESSPDKRQPIFVHTTRRVHHDAEADVPASERDETIESYEYSDGFGRLLQTRAQAEDVLFGDPVFGDGTIPSDQSIRPGDIIGRKRDPNGPPNVVVSGWQIYDNKGRVVEKFEPFFSSGWQYRSPQDELDQFNRNVLGKQITMFYDPRGHVIRTVNPDRSEQRVIFGVPGTVGSPDLNDPAVFEPTPWEAYTYDANDNAGRTHAGQSVGYVHHWDTPSSVKVDALGRTIETVARNCTAPGDPIEEHRTRMTYDIRGNVLTLTDALGRVAFRHVYDLANRKLRVDSMDAGVRKTIFDAAGQVIEQRDGKGAWQLHAYDSLRRPTRLWARDNPADKFGLRVRMDYGDGGKPDQAPGERAFQQLANRLGKLHKQYDEAGRLTVEKYDFKGNILEKERRVISDQSILEVFDPPPPNWQIAAFRIDWQPAAGTSLEDHAAVRLDAASYRTSVQYDALNRLKRMLCPKDVENARKELVPHYNRAGALESVSLERIGAAGARARDTFVERIAYNAKGQRTLIAYGNGVLTGQAYDAQTFRLKRLWTGRYTKPAGAEFTYRPTLADRPLQDLAYEYDLVGNIRKVQERTPGCGVINTQQGRDALDRAFTYDAVYRLVSATGRESTNIPAPRPWADARRGGFNSGNHGTANQDNAPQLTRRYTEEYRYDPAGNLVSLTHGQNGTAWTRHFGLGGSTPQQWQSEWPTHLNSPDEWENPPPNRLTHVGDNRTTFPQTHAYDASGNLTRETTSRHFEWDHSDRLIAFRTQAGNSEPTIHAYYLYDAGGQRTKKLVRHKGGPIEATVYIDGVFEYQRIVRGNVMRENNSLHVMDNQNRIALVRIGDAFPGDATPTLKYYLGDHLGSSNLTIDSGGNWVNREEYTPYGETSFGSFARKRYRYTGKERDEETGFYYHGARYYAPWLVRWISPDPIGFKDGPNLYAYVRGNPINLIDGNGTDSNPPIASGLGPNASVSTEDKNQRSSMQDRLIDQTNEENSQFLQAYQEGKLQPQKFDAEQWRKDVDKALKQTETPANKLARTVAAAERYRQEQYQAELRKEAEVEKELPGTAASLVPIYGSGKSSYVHFSHGNYGRGAFYGALAISDVFLVKSLVVGGGKLVLRGGAALLAASEAERNAPRLVWAGGETQWGAALRPPAPMVSDTAPKLTYTQGYQLGNDLAQGGYTLALGKFPGNVRYVDTNLAAFTIDRPWGWTPMYNAGGVRGALEAGGNFVFTSRTYTGTFQLEAEQVFRAGVRPQFAIGY